MKEKCEICDKFFSLDTHHIQSTSKGGLNNDSNKCNICPNCHRQVHTGNIIIEGRFMLLNKGNAIVWRKKGENSITGVKDPDVWIYGETNEI